MLCLKWCGDQQYLKIEKGEPYGPPFQNHYESKS